MAITLKCTHESGSVAFPPDLIEGWITDERRYEIINGEVTLDYPEPILSHDVAVLLAMPGGLYRMPTPAEQDGASEALRQAKSVQEEAPSAPKKRTSSEG